jgi:fructose-1,6-bisphosphatase II
MSAAPEGLVDMLIGVGGVAEGVIAACAIKAMGGAILGRLAPQSDEERAALAEAGLDTRRILTSDELITSRQIFFAATGITDGALLSGVKYQSNRAATQSMILRCETGTRRFIEAEHLIE